MPQPRRVGRPIRRGGRFFDLFRAKRGFPATAMSRWSPNTTWILSNTTWRALFCPFPGKKREFCHSHGALETQYDVDHSQHDMAGVFPHFSELKEGVLSQPCRVERPMRRGAPPTRRGWGFFDLFQAKRGCTASATSRWTPNATWRSSNAS